MDDLFVTVRSAQQGDTDALTILIQLYQTPARRVAQNILGNLDDAEDAVQDSWLLALRKLHTLVKLSVVNYPLVHQREYALTIAARDHSITTYIDGALVNQVTESAWLQGQIGLNIWEVKTLFRDLKMRVLE